MSGSDPAHPEALLAHLDFVRSLARSLLADRADDLTQEACVAALQHRPRQFAQMREWLAVIVRNLARNLRRGERRRRQHELVAPPATEPDPIAEVLAREELRRRVVAAVLELPEAHRSVVLAVYFDGLTCAEIARRERAPAATVRSRLQRALDLLRQRLDRATGLSRRVWTAGLVPLARAPGVALGAGVLWTGGIVMKKTIGVAAAAVLVLGALAVWQSGGFENHDLEAGDPAPIPATTARAVAHPAPAPDPDVAEVSVPSQRQAVAPATDETCVRGRCLDARTGSPLAGCRVDLHLNSRDPVPANLAYERPVGVVTDIEGRFEIRTTPPAVYEFVLVVRADGRGTMRQTWYPLPTGKVIDVGDVAMPEGVLLTGRVIDEAGVPVDKVRISLQCDTIRAPRSAGLQQQDYSSAVSLADGSIQSDQALTSGRWSVDVDAEHRLLRPGKLVVAQGQRFLRTDLVVQRVDSLPQIRGTVVDEQGLPVQGISVNARDEGTAFTDSGLSGHDGTFAIRRRRTNDEHSFLSIAPHGSHVLAGEPLRAAWGTKDARVVVKAQLSLRVRAVEAGTGRPVESYTACFLPAVGPITPGARVMRVRCRHEHGVVVLERVPPGKHRVIVYPDSADLVCNAPIDVVVTPTGADVLVELQRRAPLAVHVRRQDGTPVPDTRVELLRNDGPGALLLNTITSSVEDAHNKVHTTGPLGIVLATGSTDAAGRVNLLGPPEGNLYVKALGPGHVPELRSGVTIAQGGASLELIVEQGATIEGKVLPAGLLAKLGGVVQVTLVEVGGTRRRMPAKPDGGSPLGADGSFALEGIPAGDWKLHLYFMQPEFMGSASRTPELLSVNGLRDGETREIEVDASSLMPATISGRILLDGQPYREQQGVFVDQRGIGSTKFATDAHGAFSVDVQPGELLLVLLPMSGAASRPHGSTVLPDGATFVVRPAEKLERNFVVQRLRARIRVLEADGTPATERHLTIAGAMLGEQRRRVDQDGWLLVDPAAPGPIWISTWPKKMTTDDASTQAGAGFGKSPDAATLLALQVPLGQVQIPAGQTEGTFELRVPAGR